MSGRKSEPPELNIIVKPLHWGKGTGSGVGGRTNSGVGRSHHGWQDWSFRYHPFHPDFDRFNSGFGSHSAWLARQQAQAKAAEIARNEQAMAAHRQLIDSLYQAQQATRSELDRSYAQARDTLSANLETEVQRAVRAPRDPGNERWQLYLISKKKAEVAGLIATKQAALNNATQKMLAFDGRHPLLNDGKDYSQQLLERSAGNAEVAHAQHQSWAGSYIAAHEAALITESIRLLEQRIEVLSEQYARDAIMWREHELRAEAFRQKQHEREEHVKHHQRVEEAMRHTRLLAANTRYIPADMAARGAVFLGRSDAALAQDVARALQAQISAAVSELVRIALIRAGQMLAVGITTALHSPVLGNGELTPAQRRRFSQGVGVNAEVMGLPANIDLPAIAGAGAMVDLPARIKLVPVDQGTELHVVAVGPGFTAQVPVIMAAPHSLTGNDKSLVSGLPARQVVMDSAPPASDTLPVEHQVFGTELQVVELPSGVDLRFDDCILCFAPELGLAPLYLSFPVPAAGYGVVTGQGVPGDKDWRLLADSSTGAALPEQIGERLRQREFHSLQAFEQSVWRVVAESTVLASGFDPLNVKRMLSGMPPYAPKAHWLGERRHYEIRTVDPLAAQANPFDLGNLVMTKPDSDYGVVRFTPVYQPWPTSAANLHWTPLRAPGTELLGGTTTPAAPQDATVIPGSDSDPLPVQVTPLPAADPRDVQAATPGYAEGDDLPSPDLMFAEPVKVLEVGPYDKLERRSRGDGLDVDHILSRAAYIRMVRMKAPLLSEKQARKMSNSAPSIVIPKEIHEKYSETFKWKNTTEKQMKDATDPEAGVNSNFDAIKVGLLELGFDEHSLEEAREALHKAYREGGYY